MCALYGGMCSVSTVLVEVGKRVSDTLELKLGTGKGTQTVGGTLHH